MIFESFLAGLAIYSASLEEDSRALAGFQEDQERDCAVLVVFSGGSIGGLPGPGGFPGGSIEGSLGSDGFAGGSIGGLSGPGGLPGGVWILSPFW